MSKNLRRDACEKFISKWPNASYGPAHIVVDDGNTDNEYIQFALQQIDTYCDRDYSNQHPSDELVATRMLLNHLLDLPEDGFDEEEEIP